MLAKIDRASVGGVRSAASIALVASLFAPAQAWAEGVGEVLRGTDDSKVRLTHMLGLVHRGGFDPTYAAGARLAYSVSPALHLELFGAYLFPGGEIYDPQSKLQVRSDEQYARRTELLWAMGLAAWWRPIFGAVAFDDVVLGRFRLELGAGVALGETRTPCTNGLPLDPNRGFPRDAQGQTVCNPDDLQQPTGDPPNYYAPSILRPIGQLAAAAELSLLDVVSVRLELRDLFFVSRVFRPREDPALDDDVAHWLLVQLGVGVIF